MLDESYNKMSDRDLLITMVTEQKHIKESLKELKDAVSTKVGIVEFQKLELKVSEVQKSQEGINVKFAWYGGAIAVITTIATFLANKYF